MDTENVQTEAGVAQAEPVSPLPGPIDWTSEGVRFTRLKARQCYSDDPGLWEIVGEVNGNPWDSQIAFFCDGGYPGKAKAAALMFMAALAVTAQGKAGA